MMYRARLALRSSITPSNDSIHSVVSSGSMSGNWLGRPSLMTGRLRSVATGVPSNCGYACSPWVNPARRGRSASRRPGDNLRVTSDGGEVRSEVITVRTGDRPTVRDITDEAARFVSGEADGLLHVFVPHATAGVALIETGAGSGDDLLRALDDLLPADDRWRHRHGSHGHGRDHVLPAFVAPYATLPVP